MAPPSITLTSFDFLWAPHRSSRKIRRNMLTPMLLYQLDSSCHSLATTHYATNSSILGTLLIRPIHAWFAPLVEIASSLLDDFSTFLTVFDATFMEMNRRCTALNKVIPYNKIIAWSFPMPQYFARSPTTWNGMNELYTINYVGI